MHVRLKQSGKTIRAARQPVCLLREFKLLDLAVQGEEIGPIRSVFDSSPVEFKLHH